MRDFDPEEESLLERYDRSRLMYRTLMNRSLEHRFQRWVNKNCTDVIHAYEECVGNKWPWELYICQETLDAITKCRLDHNTQEGRQKFLERERELLAEMDKQGETLFDHDLTFERPREH